MPGEEGGLAIMALEAAGFASGVGMERSVVGNVAALAPGAEVGGVAMLGRVVEVGNGEHDAAAGDGVGLVVASAAVRIGGATFATMPGAGEDGAADVTPVFRVARPVFDGHGADSGILWSVMVDSPSVNYD